MSAQTLVEVEAPTEHKNGSHLVAKNKDNHPKLIDAIVFLLTDMRMYSYRFYGEFGQYINYKEDNSIPTAGVTYHKGKLYMVWNRKFCDNLTKSEALFLFLHEISHLLGNCHKRIEYNGLNHQYSNIAHDMVINTNLIEDNSLKDFISMIKGGYVVPKKYEGERILEPIYNFLQEHDENVEKERQKKESQKPKQQPQKGDEDEDGEKQDGQGGKGEEESDENGDQQGDGQGKGEPSDEQGDGQGGGGQGEPSDEQGDGQGGGNPLTGNSDVPLDENGAVGDLPEDKKYKEYGENGQTIDVHFDPKNKLEKELMERIAKDITEKLKNRGLVTGDIQRMLDSLERKPNNWLAQLKRCIVGAKGIGNHSKTYRRANRVGVEGLRGRRKNAIVFDVILDTSGSMTDDIPKVLGTILRNGIVCNIVQIDTKVQSDTLIQNPRDLRNIELKGFGGTVLQPAIDYIIEKKQIKRPCVIMTDGYTDNLDIRGIGDKVIILTTGVVPPLTGSNYKVIDCSTY